MPRLYLWEAIRYFLSGLVGFFYLYIFDSKLVNLMENFFGAFGITVCIFFFGVIIYLLYRSLIYDTLIIWFQDKARRKSENYRTHFKKIYGISTSQADLIYKHLRDEYFAEKHLKHKTETSGIHLLYISGLLSFLFFVVSLFSEAHNQYSFFILLTIIFLVGGFLSDRRFESFELGWIKSIDQQKIDSIKEKLFDQNEQ